MGYKEVVYIKMSSYPFAPTPILCVGVPVWNEMEYGVKQAQDERNERIESREELSAAFTAEFIEASGRTDQEIFIELKI